MSANEKQIGGEHYKSPIQHWDYVVANDLDYFQAQITKYVTRWKKKAGIVDLEKALHFLEKYIEVEKTSTGSAIVPVTSKELKEITSGKSSSNKVVAKRYTGMRNPFGYYPEEDEE